MPSTLPIPTLDDYRKAFHRGVRAKRDKRADGHAGSVYDYVAGSSATLMARESQYIRDLFRKGYFATAKGDDLTELVAKRYGIDRILDTYGPGTATLSRPTAGGGGGTIYAGTRIRILGGSTQGLAFSVANDTSVAAGQLYVAGLPIRATVLGSGHGIDTTMTGQPAVIDDPLWDNSWVVSSVRCGNGTDFEPAQPFRARVLDTLRKNTVGYALGMAIACNNAGAQNVSIFGTNYGGQDLHACAIYVGDAGFNGSTALIQSCITALEKWRVLGADPVIAAMAATPLLVTATVTLTDDPSLFGIDVLASSCASAIRRAFARSDSYGYDLDSLFGAIIHVSDAIQDVAFTSPTSSQGLLVGSPPFFPPSLPRYSIPLNGINLTFVGPS